MTTKKTRSRKTAYAAGPATIPAGTRRLVEIKGRVVAIFNVAGDYVAMHNRCPHMGGPICEGPITGTTMHTAKTEFIYGRDDELVRCGWHGWEFEIKTGRCLTDEKMRAKLFEVAIENGDLYVYM